MHFQVIHKEDGAIAQVVSCRPLTVEAHVRDRVSPCRICGE
jgi:hypothetical protein